VKGNKINMKIDKAYVLKNALEDAAAQLMTNASMLGYASDLADKFHPEIKQVLETMIEQTSYHISKIQKILKDVE
jgi:uncharacterized protein with PIN domain